MDRRLALQTELEELLGSRNVYFQPPESKKLEYPCIIYNRSGIDSKHADDRIYNAVVAYDVMVIDKDPDSNLVEAVLFHFPMINHTRHYTVDNLNHDVFYLYY